MYLGTFAWSGWSYPKPIRSDPTFVSLKYDDRLLMMRGGDMNIYMSSELLNPAVVVRLTLPTTCSMHFRPMKAGFGR